MDQPWLETLHTDTPQLGFELAVRLSRVAVKMTQPSEDVRASVRAVYERDPASLIAASQVVATNFATVSAANNWWRIEP